MAMVDDVRVDPYVFCSQFSLLSRYRTESFLMLFKRKGDLRQLLLQSRTVVPVVVDQSAEIVDRQRFDFLSLSLIRILAEDVIFRIQIRQHL